MSDLELNIDFFLYLWCFPYLFNLTWTNDFSSRGSIWWRWSSGVWHQPCQGCNSSCFTIKLEAKTKMHKSWLVFPVISSLVWRTPRRGQQAPFLTELNSQNQSSSCPVNMEPSGVQCSGVQAMADQLVFIPPSFTQRRGVESRAE